MGDQNVELLRRTEEQFEVVVTADQKLRYQQNLSGRSLAIVVIPTNQVRAVIRLLPALFDDFYRVAFRKKIYRKLEKLQVVLDAWLTDYNKFPPRKSLSLWQDPLQTFVDSVSLAKEKILTA